MSKAIQNIYVFVVYQTLSILLLLLKTTLISIFKLIVPYKYRCKSVKGETVLITGSGSGIGKFLAKKLAKHGAKMVLVDIDEKGNQATANEILMDGGKANTFTCDLSKKEDIYRVVEEVNPDL